MADDKRPKAHEDVYLNDPPLKDLPEKGTERDPDGAAKDPSAGRTDEHRNRPGREKSNNAS